jgi:2-dehydro-3-deoxyphosphogluconate aldolase / (4S)-4-hydroxy-2-oxoglutarate aldolase
MMHKAQLKKRIEEIGVVPVIRAASAAEARFAADAIASGGISIAEITMTVPGAVEVIAELTRTMPGILVGAGTVLNPEAAKRCVDAGAKFLVSPGLNVKTIEFANRENIPIMAGALTPTEVINAWEAGADYVKVFPCGQMGGASYIRALKGPLPDVPLVPTGGVNLDTAPDFIMAGSVALGVGGELLKKDVLKSRNSAALKELAEKFVAIVKWARQQKAAG